MKPIEKQSAVDLATDRIIEFIKSGEIKVGEKLPSENEMCSILNISRTTIREAYRKLEPLGYLEIRIGRGAFVKNINQNLLQEAFNWFQTHNVKMKEYLQVRLSLDPLAARLAAQRSTEEDIEKLKSIQDSFIDSFNEKDNNKMALFDAEFHEKIVHMTNNELLIALIKIVNFHFVNLRETSFKIEKHGFNALEPHKSIIDALASRDQDLAAKASVDHMITAYKDLCGEAPHVVPR